MQEQRWAAAYGCRFVGVVEKDARHHSADFGAERARAPPDLEHLFDGVEFIDYERRDYKGRAVVDEILRRSESCGP